ncbi:tripartite tricarboxylate transporter substrate binding protein [Halobacillus naozhouensis]|uniref:Tripartite tricarboxylate transporter substrate binding protein n=1 Tax=Halobacillus naozhouensis TaxID=554880 RepID=A0ABY8J450_9BACI|nr:tripartite tricarboxylate transporter substrate binding protein [Halobacillus naozhouensis]WFT75651.1 tripartite tricarboxylate transporter substrate binding protein [Halobacillus naozhouensis]
MLKKLFSMFAIFGLILVLAACGGGSSASSGDGGSSEGSGAEGYPNKPIDIIVAYAAGGGTDTGARILKPYLEEELGVTVNIVNKPGGGGWVGWTELANAEPDGYTIGYINSPNLMTGYLNPAFNRDESLESFIPIANHVTDAGAIAIRPDDDRFSNIEELIEYAKTHELTVTSTGVGSDDHYASLKMNDKLGTKFKPVHNKGSADSRAQVLGGHIDVLFANVGEVFNYHKDGKLKVVATMGEERSPFLEKVPTLAEKGHEVYSWSSRGLAAPKGVDPAKIEILQKALEKSIKNEKQIEQMSEMGLEVNYLEGESYMESLKQDEQDVKDLRDLLGW